MEDEIIKGFVTGFCLSVCDFFDRRGSKNRKLKVLRKKLSDVRYKWRSTKQLSRAIGQSSDATVELLLELGARRNAGEKDIWTLKK